MSKPNRNYYGTQPNKPIYKTKPRPTNPIQSIDGNTYNNNNGNIPNSHEPVVHNKYWPPSLTDIIAFCMLVVTGALAWFTFGLYQSATDDSKTSQLSEQAANQSAITAQRTLNEIKDYNTKSLDKQQSSLDSGFKRDTTTFGIQNRSFNETQKEFDIENRPLIQALDISYDTLEVDKPITVKYLFINYGKQPVKCLTNKETLFFYEKNNRSTQQEKIWVDILLNVYLSGTSNAQQKIKTFYVAKKKDIADVKNGKIIATLMGELTFQNTVTFDKSVYKYEYELEYINNLWSVRGIQDTTIVIKPNVKKIRR